MSTTAAPHPQLNDWIQLTAGLAPLEQLALIGLTQRNPALTAPQISIPSIVGEEKCHSASLWLSKNIRGLLHVYCDFCSRTAMPVGGQPADTMALIGALSGMIMSVLGYTPAAAAAFSAWALQNGVKLWCGRYGRQQLDGAGTYVVMVDMNYDGSFPPGESPPEIPGMFSISYQPEIKEVVRDKRYTHVLHQVNITERARAQGVFIPDDARRLDDILEFKGARHAHKFGFTDTRSKLTLNGTVDLEQLACDASALRFHSATCDSL